MFGQRCASGATISAIRCSSASSSTIARPAKSADDLGREVVGGRPEAAAGDDQVDALARRGSAARPRMSSRPVADDHDVRELDAQLAQPLRQPRAVAVGDDPAEHLRARDDDAGARAHVQVGAWSSGSERGARRA